MRRALNQFWKNKQAILFSVGVASVYLAYLLSAAETQKQNGADKTDLKNCELLHFVCDNAAVVTQLLAKQSKLSSTDWAKLSSDGVGILQNAVQACASAVLPGFFSCVDAGLSHLSSDDNAALGLGVLVQRSGCMK